MRFVNASGKPELKPLELWTTAKTDPQRDSLDPAKETDFPQGGRTRIKARCLLFLPYVTVPFH